jgi:hypothetical protein
LISRVVKVETGTQWKYYLYETAKMMGERIRKKAVGFGDQDRGRFGA